MVAPVTSPRLTQDPVTQGLTTCTVSGKGRPGSVRVETPPVGPDTEHPPPPRPDTPWRSLARVDSVK